MAHARLSRPDSGLGFQVDALDTFQVVPSSLGSGENNNKEGSCFLVPGSWFRVPGPGFRVSGFRFRVSGSGVLVSGFGFRAPGSGFRGSGPFLCQRRTQQPSLSARTAALRSWPTTPEASALLFFLLYYSRA